MGSKIKSVSEYGLYLDIDIISGETGEVIGYHSEQEFCHTYEQACKVAEKYRNQIGQQFCSWGSDIGILKEVYVDEEPCINQYVE